MAKDLLTAALEAYGIDKKYVMSSREIKETGEIVIVTTGGSKVRYKEGMEKAEGFKPLNNIQITGINPETAKRKPIAGKKK